MLNLEVFSNSLIKRMQCGFGYARVRHGPRSTVLEIHTVPEKFWYVKNIARQVCIDAKSEQLSAKPVDFFPLHPETSRQSKTFRYVMRLEHSLCHSFFKQTQLGALRNCMRNC